VYGWLWTKPRLTMGKLRLSSVGCGRVPVLCGTSSARCSCMWYGPKTHLQPIRAHRKAGPADNAPLTCDADEAEMVPMPLKPGSAGFHAGRTLHYSRGNTTDTHRRAYIMNFRPRAMIELFRERGFDHGRAGNKTHAVRTGHDSSTT
jgi:hypothetical protein